MRRYMQLRVACVLFLAYQCAAQGGGGSRPKATYAPSRSFDQWEHGLHQDPLILVAFITAIVSGELRLTADCTPVTLQLTLKASQLP